MTTAIRVSMYIFETINVATSGQQLVFVQLPKADLLRIPISVPIFVGGRIVFDKAGDSSFHHQVQIHMIHN